jgi:predicted nucleic acid-binding protein
VPFYQLDASAIVKRYVTEIGSVWVRVLLDPAAGHTISIAEVTRAEVASALSRRARDGSVPATESAELIRTFEAHCVTQYRLVPTDHAIVGQSVHLVQQHPLRAYDAIQLATAIHVHQILVTSGFPALIFVSADDVLLATAQAEGLLTENPNDHP